MESEKHSLFEKFSSFEDEDEDFEPDELVNFDIDKIAPAPEVKSVALTERTPEEELLELAEKKEDTGKDNDLASIVKFFEN
jgi:hypothetical protein